MSDLSERLRETRTYYKRPQPINPDGPEAADALDAKDATIARLTVEIERRETARQDDMLEKAAWRTRVATLERERGDYIDTIHAMVLAAGFTDPATWDGEGYPPDWQTHPKMSLAIKAKMDAAEARIAKLTEERDALIRSTGDHVTRTSDLLERIAKLEGVEKAAQRFKDARAAALALALSRRDIAPAERMKAETDCDIALRALDAALAPDQPQEPCDLCGGRGWVPMEDPAIPAARIMACPACKPQETRAAQRVPEDRVIECEGCGWFGAARATEDRDASTGKCPSCGAVMSLVFEEPQPQEPCPRCEGSGFDGETACTELLDCPACGGTGKRKPQEDTDHE